VVAVSLVLLAACGRIDFDPRGASSIDAPGTTDAGNVIPSGAGIWLEMNTGPVGGIIDSAGGHTSSCTGPCPALGPGLHGNGYVFTGQQIDVTYASDLAASAGFTAGLWLHMDVFPSGADDPACVWTMSFDAANGYDTFTLCIGNSGTTEFGGETPAGVSVNDFGPTIGTNSGEWHHMAVTWDGARRLAYVDGVQIANRVTALGTGTENLELGAARGLFHFFGTLDDAVYYTRVLTPAEITQLATR